MTVRRKARRPSDETPKPQTAGTAEETETDGSHPGRRKFLGYLLAAPTLVAAAEIGQSTLPESAGPFAPPRANAAGIPSNPQTADVYDLEDALTDSMRPTANLVTVTINKDGTATYEIPRAEVGQGITTSMAMVVAEELELPLEKVHVPLAPARPELVFNQFTGGSNSTNSLYYPARVAAAVAKGKLLEAASIFLGDYVNVLTAKAGVITSTLGGSIGYGALAEKAAAVKDAKVPVNLKDEKDFKIVGKPTKRTDAYDAVTGRKQFTLDSNVRPNAMPTMLAMAPTINGTPKAISNMAEVKKMPGVVDVAMITNGAAIMARTFGQCIDAIRKCDISWNPGPVDNESDESVAKELKAAALPSITPHLPKLPVGTRTVDSETLMMFATNAALEPGTAIADVRKDSAEIWTGSKMPIVMQADIAKALGLPQNAVKIHVMTAGGSFGRRLFPDPAIDAAEASQAFGRPVKYMWPQTSDKRRGRVHPMSFSRIRANVVGKNVVSYEQHHASVRTSYSHGFGEALTSAVTRLPLAGLSVSEIVFETTESIPYNFGVTKQALVETHQSTSQNQRGGDFNTSSMRNVYSPNVVTAHELFMDKLAKELGMDPYEARLHFAKDESYKKVIQAAGKYWHRPLPKGFSRGIGVHREYKQTMACYVEMDCRPETVNRPIREGVTGPRVTRVLFVREPGMLVVNPLGMDAQQQGGIHDGIALAMTSSVHLRDGQYLEGSWDDYHYTRQWNTPHDIEIVSLPPKKNERIAGAGESAVAPSMAASACAYAAAFGQPERLPVNHGDITFEPLPNIPSCPQSPTDGLDYAY